MNGVWKFSCILYCLKYGISICPSLWSTMWVFGEIGCLLVSAWTLISGWSQIRVHLWLIQTSSGEVSSEILWMCYQSCSGCWQIWGVLFVWEFITTNPSSRCLWFILQKLQKTLGFPWCIQFMNVHWRFCQTIKWHKCAFSSLPLNASWVKSLWNWNRECVTTGSPIVQIWLPSADLGSACKLAPQSPCLRQGN